MDAVVKFPIKVSCHWQLINYNSTKKLSIRLQPSRTKCNLHSNKMDLQRHGIKKKILNKSWDRHRILAMVSKGDSEYRQSSVSPAQITVDQFYRCINEKDLQHLDECISEEACFEDYAFTKPFHGKEEIMSFFRQLTRCMGKNVKFRVKHICEGDDLTATVNWHLEWQKKTIPFTRGCTFFKLSMEGQKMVIWRAEVLIESPIKPGIIVLTLLKNVTSIFDDYPTITEWFLRSPHAILTWIFRIYNMFVAPWLNPLLEVYIRLWGLFARLLNSAITLGIFISKIFFK
ncbi:hypothetical protein Fmac_002021 [Flemingia macrophylla]|uniref:SnoaL-like domain-containing protein n=1 Tax=Flemingia macrophylla TaxID=520843 RepID=A0ABD1NIV8_9FABA